MPDPTFRTVSATQVSALFDQNPYTTRWLLWRIFMGYDQQPELDPEENERLLWGNLLEPAVFHETLRRLNVEGEYNEASEYLVSENYPTLGCTPDGLAFHPSKGIAVVQCKCVDWLRWKDTWSEDKAPAHIELQIQHEMLVKGAEWGVISCLVGGNELLIYERVPEPELQNAILNKVDEFMHSLVTREGPDPLGDPMEVPTMLRISKPEREFADCTANEEVYDAMQALKIYDERQKEAAKIVKKAKATILKYGMDADVVLAHGYGCEIKRFQTKESAVALPEHIRLGLEKARVNNTISDEDQDAIVAAYNWREITRRAGSRATYKVFDRETEGPAPWLSGFDENPLQSG